VASSPYSDGLLLRFAVASATRLRCSSSRCIARIFASAEPDAASAHTRSDRDDTWRSVAGSTTEVLTTIIGRLWVAPRRSLNIVNIVGIISNTIVIAAVTFTATLTAATITVVTVVTVTTVVVVAVLNVVITVVACILTATLHLL
jgi:hypothetical protein